jgi:hypothetical protein
VHKSKTAPKKTINIWTNWRNRTFIGRWKIT